uniref:Uncharacterized protein n=1 Tax=Hyaloperonospora arabidopsidis (strain Emoy2) TaxID=559515 RepID=M4BU10_HYAAE
MDFNMATRSYAGVNWLLFVRTDIDNDDVIFTALVSRGKNIVAERTVDTTALIEHGEEIGLEMDTCEFKALLLFSPTISRKGVFRLPIVAADAPVSLVTLLTSIHAKPPYPKHFEDKQTHNRKSDGTTTALQNTSSTDAEPALIKPGLLKKRLVPAGTTRRKGPRGAKLAKK